MTLDLGLSPERNLKPGNLSAIRIPQSSVQWAAHTEKQAPRNFAVIHKPS
ncbi:MAG: hypothetical protein K0R24_684, partial [Gammaproteobacteria bacterium]|nr:hypothetical protein [Gammaproteobacteria bacterium]